MALLLPVHVDGYNKETEPFALAGEFRMRIPPHLRRFAGLREIVWEMACFEWLKVTYTQDGDNYIVVQMKNKEIDLQKDKSGYGLIMMTQFNRHQRLPEEAMNAYMDMMTKQLLHMWTDEWAREYIKDWPE